MLEKKPLKIQFIITFILILLLSLIATLLTYFVGFKTFQMLDNKKVYPANYYEKKVPDIESYVRKRGSIILNKIEKQSLEKVIPLDGIKYQVIDENGQKVYGTDSKRVINGKEDLYNKLNTNIGRNGDYIRIIPLIDPQGKIVGALSLSYILKMNFVNTLDKIWIIPLFIVVFFSPFIYITVFTLLFSRKFTGNIRKPVNMLIQASKKVKEKDLDFKIEYSSDNELGILCEAFNEMKEELKKSLLAQWRIERERNEMVEALAHDLKTPLSIINGYVEFLLEGHYENKERLIKYLHVIKDNTNKGSKLVKEMLYAAELESMDSARNIEPFDLPSFLLEKQKSYEILARDKKINLQVNLHHEQEDQRLFFIDQIQLERILDNIVINSMGYTPDGGNITIEVYRKEDSLRILVCDSGKGFSLQDLSNIFHKFYRGDKSRSSKGGNSGLGLYIVKKLVEMNGGSIKAFNSNEGGACIEFFLSQKVTSENF